MKKLIVIIGPTGIGKTDLSIEIAQELNTEIISCDSRQIYKELKIGTAVPTNIQLNKVKHHFIGNKSIYDYYNASMFEVEVLELLDKLFLKNETVIMTGGSGLYIDAVCKGIDDLPTIDQELRAELINRLNKEGIESLRMHLKMLDPDYYKEADIRNPKRILKALEVTLQTGKPYSTFLTKPRRTRDFKIVKIGLQRNRNELYERINLRVDQMIDDGLIDEARIFYKDRLLNSLNTVGYKELFDYFDGSSTLEKAIELIKQNSRHYAKRQISWFGRDKEIAWFHSDRKNEILEFIRNNC
ncbi:MAG: tRNA (adenosine(37)-N6)-dimethylallyltransferase MiaA [Bacteroidetes bacterium GWC2_33_15]|nr:MAG: tRNA (adenosine(37)-N6)-dimethylallyltransferase MiaA [Bacteroidetes bacterium GWA2_33_15]OFX50361.1 MAG: tRNA (adenosine(37)-N6)-dimethylallyltransferase MiaA [Bacteroidetes bacterium GWC2_33_15]OFX66722.1 MAG: tRNA (adenosine(37)-N6)-dimethylallyltransferase MiaA [Bacteroidetes bacterium GWB2_32_14]OFX69340.1 MAG: tRNA (adenosine(37)-N6)-dimethylallyltransferase MiaA [Bacteroidetes bacterium GWD2_33_33]HAN18658.1 tRNA (adenosine(37)-N6)-dimethylallyltransferase MiaA [Bacteroidales bac